jgi:glutamate racemase
MDNQKPIGVFDSGIGGLTVARAIAKELPNEKIIYFGDTAHFPYGDKASSSIKRYSEVISEFLLKKNCKAIVIACNTASAAAAISLKKHIPEGILLFDVIHPVVNHINQYHSKQKIGIIATKGTTNSKIYPKLIASKNENINVASLATPLLAPMIEEGFFNNSISKTIIGEYLSKNKIKDIDALVLACTHYPIIEKEIAGYYSGIKKKITILNSAKIVAENIATELKRLNQAADTQNNKHEFFVSDFTKSFEKSSEIFFGESIKLGKMDLWK